MWETGQTRAIHKKRRKKENNIRKNAEANKVNTRIYINISLQKFI